MTTFGMNGMYENAVAGGALDLDGATADVGPEAAEDDVDPAADLGNPQRGSDGVPIGRPDPDADAAPN